MRTFPLFIAFTIVSVAGYCQDLRYYPPKDMAALQALPETWVRCWNAHNMDSMGTMLTEDVDFVSVAGNQDRGKTAAVNHHKRTHLTQFKNSVFSIDSVDIKYVKPDLAIIHFGWGLKGDLDPDGTPRQPRHGIFTWVTIKSKGRWLLLAVSNVNIRSTLSPPK